MQDSADAASTATSLLSAFRTSGFLYLKDHPIPAKTLEQVYSHSARFFSRPASQKDSLAWTTARANRGYVCIGREKVSQSATKDDVAMDRQGGGEDMKESFEIGREGDEAGENQWPDRFGDNEGTEFRVVMQDFFLQCKDIHAFVMKGIAQGMGLRADFFEDYISKGDNTLRLLHYPPVSKDGFKGGRVRAGIHSDYGSVTLLFQDARGGLQVETPEGKWVDVEPIEGTIVVNAGDLLARWSNEQIRSTKHRVVEPPLKLNKEENEDGYPPRYSIAYFSNPDFDKVIEALPGTWEQSKGERPKFGRIRSGEYLEQRLSATY